MICLWRMVRLGKEPDDDVVRVRDAIGALPLLLLLLAWKMKAT